jgi:hypothetical protein
MKTLLDSGFFSYVRENVSGDEIPGFNQINDMYENFAKTLFAFCKAQGDNMYVFFVLNYTRIEFVSIQNGKVEYESGKK